MKAKANFHRKIPKWISPIVAFTVPKLLEWKNILTYKDILNEQAKLKTEEELGNLGWHLNWCQKVQLGSRFTKDQKEGIQEIDLQLDRSITGLNKK